MTDPLDHCCELLQQAKIENRRPLHWRINHSGYNALRSHANWYQAFSPDGGSGQQLKLFGIPVYLAVDDRRAEPSIELLISELPHVGIPTGISSE